MSRSYKVILATIALAPVFTFAQLINLEQDTQVGVTTTSSTNVRADVMIDSEISISREDIESNGSATASVEVEEVNTEADLEAYAAGAIYADDGVKEMKFSDDTVEVQYKQRGRILAMIPVTFYVKAIAHSDGTVELKYPWYSFVTIDHSANTEAQVRLALETTLNARADSSVTTDGTVVGTTAFTAEESARIAAQMQTVLRSNFESGVE